MLPAADGGMSSLPFFAITVYIIMRTLVSAIVVMKSVSLEENNYES